MHRTLKQIQTHSASCDYIMWKMQLKYILAKIFYRLMAKERCDIFFESRSHRELIFEITQNVKNVVPLNKLTFSSKLSSDLGT